MTIVEQVLSTVFMVVHGVGDLAADIAIHVLILLYAPYKSIKAVRSVDTSDDTAMLMFWVCYAGMTFVDELLSISTEHLPFYRLAKLGFIMWLLLGNGSLYLFKRVAEPFMTRYEAVIDDAINRMDVEYRQKYFSDDKGLEQLIKDKQEFVQKNGAKLYNTYLKIGLEKNRANSVHMEKSE